jgi:hypothetical protein
MSKPSTPGRITAPADQAWRTLGRRLVANLSSARTGARLPVPPAAYLRPSANDPGPGCSSVLTGQRPSSTIRSSATGMAFPRRYGRPFLGILILIRRYTPAAMLAASTTVPVLG